MLLHSVVLFASTLLHTSLSACVSSIPDKDRYFFLNNINILRELAAKGKAPNKCGTVPTGKNMYKLKVDCDLEAEAHAYTSKCGSGPLGSNMIAVSYGGLTINVENSILNALTSWAIQAQNVGVPDNMVFSNSSLSAWANLLNGETTAIGCAYTVCSGLTSWIYIACKFEKPGNLLRATIYDPGMPCASDADCTTHRGSTCDASKGLCSPPRQDLDDGTSAQCPTTQALTDYQRSLLLETHNNLRSSLALGKEFDIAIGGNAPKAKQMRKMVYNCTVEANAAAWAQNCLFQHSTNAQRPGMGENLYMHSDKTQKKADSLVDASNAWWSELKEFGVGSDNILTQEVFNRGVGHYTQMAWETTTSVGCASISCPSMTLVVCQYYPAGNWLNNIIYTKGEPCQDDSGCPGAQTCSVAEGLCVA